MPNAANIDIASAEDLVDAQNEVLRVELGVTPAQALDVESSTPALAPPSDRDFDVLESLRGLKVWRH